MAFDFNDPKTFALMQLASGLMAGGAPSYGPPKNLLGVLGGAGPGALHSFMLAKQQQRLDEQAKAPPGLMNVPPGGSIFDPNTRLPVFTAPTTQRPMVVGDALIDPTNPQKPLYKAPDKPQPQTPNVRDYEYAVGQGYKGTLQDFIIDQKKAGGTKVDVRVPVKLGESLAGKVGNIAESGQLAASGAVNVLDTANRVEKAIASGNVNVGPGATIRTATDQVAQFLGAGGATVEERLVNTRNVIRGLAQFAVGARKQLKGQGQVSDYEGKLIQKADAGEIDNFTIPELKDFVSVSKKLAKQVHSEHKRIITKMRSSKDAEISDLADYFDVPDLPTEEHAPQAQPRVRRYNPQTGKIE